MNREQAKQAVFAFDGDVLTYRTAAAMAEGTEYDCKQIIESTLASIRSVSSVPAARIYLSDASNFRYAVATTRPYKGKRKTIVRPPLLPFCRQYLQDKYAAKIVSNMEADDAVATDMKKFGGVHCGQDKDIKQCPGWHYNYINNEWEHITEEEATLRLFRQILTGDSGDDIPGLPRVGPKTAEKIILDAETAEQTAETYYQQIYKEKLASLDELQDTELLTTAAATYYMEQSTLIQLIDTLPIEPNNTIQLPVNTAFVNQDKSNPPPQPKKPFRL